MVSGYNTITLTSLGPSLTPEEQKKIVTMYNSNKKPLMVRFLVEGGNISIDLTTIFRRVYGSAPDGGGQLILRGYVGGLEASSNVIISIEPDDSVILKPVDA